MHPSQWSVTVRRIVGGLIMLFDGAVLLAVIVLVFAGKWEAYHATMRPFAIAAGVVSFLFVWLVVGAEEGFWKGFLVALALLVAVFAGSTLISRHMR